MRLFLLLYLSVLVSSVTCANLCQSSLWSCQVGCGEYKNYRHGCTKCECEYQTRQKELLEGDILPSQEIRVDGSTKGTPSIAGAPIWATERNQFGVYEIPYINDGILSFKVWQAVNGAIIDFYENSCIHFRPATKDDLYSVRLYDGNGCHAHVGKQPYPPNDVSLSPGCASKKGVVIHLLLHSLGFYHKNNRPDRDDYINIHWENIKPSRIKEFKKVHTLAANSFNKSYDFSSVMHYGGYAFSSNGQPTITDTNGDAVVAQRDGFSTTDLEQLNTLYRCGGIRGGSNTIMPVVPPEETLHKCRENLYGCRTKLINVPDACESVLWVKKKCPQCGRCILT